MKRVSCSVLVLIAAILAMPSMALSEGRGHAHGGRWGGFARGRGSVVRSFERGGTWRLGIAGSTRFRTESRAGRVGEYYGSRTRDRVGDTWITRTPVRSYGGYRTYRSYGGYRTYRSYGGFCRPHFVYRSGFSLGLVIATVPSYGYSYYDSYCGIQFSSLALYDDHCVRYHHPEAILVLDARSRAPLGTCVYDDGRWVVDDCGGGYADGRHGYRDDGCRDDRDRGEYRDDDRGDGYYDDRQDRGYDQGDDDDDDGGYDDGR